MTREVMIALLIIVLFLQSNKVVSSMVPTPKSYVILSNLQSGSNIGSICRNALSFGVSEVLVVGRKNYKGKMRQADRGAKEILKFRSFPSTAEAANYLKSPEVDAEIVGLEIMEGSEPLSTLTYKTGQNVAFIFGNEGKGLSENQRSVCDRFCYIPQFSSGMASINVSCCSAIVLHHFAINAGFTEASIVGEKFG